MTRSDVDQCEKLRRFNRWRRGDKRLKQPEPKAIGELIDSVADRLEVLERERLSNTSEPTHAEEMRSALRVIHTWASVPGALNAKHVLDLTAKALHMGDNVKTSAGENYMPRVKK